MKNQITLPSHRAKVKLFLFALLHFLIAKSFIYSADVTPIFMQAF